VSTTDLSLSFLTLDLADVLVFDIPESKTSCFLIAFLHDEIFPLFSDLSVVIDCLPKFFFDLLELYIF
jgi:hypothetical protein